MQLSITTTLPNKKDHKQTKQLKALLEEQSRALADETLQHGHVPPYKMEPLERLVKLKEIRSAVTSPALYRWQLLVVLCVTLALLSILFFARVRSTEVELDLSLTELSFCSSQPQVLTNLVTLSQLGASGLKKIDLPTSTRTEAMSYESPDGTTCSIRLSADSLAGTLTLAAITIPAGTRAWLRTTDIPGQYRLSVKGNINACRADVMGRVAIGLPGMMNDTLQFLSPKGIMLYPDAADANFDIRKANGSAPLFPSMLKADSILLFSFDEHVEADRTVIRRVSSIESGTIYFEALGGKERRLRHGEEIQFSTSSGEIRKLEINGDHIRFIYHGRVSGMTTGNDDNRKNIMPTYLEWLKANHGLSLLWGSVLYIFGFAITILNWWKKSK
ncbi:hypothetical protein [Terrimonas alba]|uniref:hypothetical protein n=1 Tax=Terrimonas alba TaxID=3349636 RepID=UPI0035F427C1